VLKRIATGNHQWRFVFYRLALRAALSFDKQKLFSIVAFLQHRLERRETVLFSCNVSFEPDQD
jgi:hypothetical protein